MEVIVRPQDRALCASITCITGIMRPEGRTWSKITRIMQMSGRFCARIRCPT